MRLLILLAAFAVPGSSAATEPPTPAPTPAQSAEMGVRVATDCSNGSVVHRVESPPRTWVKALGEEPPADLALTVLREVDGCNEPVIVRHDIGGAGAEAGRAVPVRTPPKARLRPAF